VKRLRVVWGRNGVAMGTRGSGGRQ